MAKKVGAGISIVTCVLLTAWMFVPHKVELYRDRLVSVGELRKPLDWFNVHEGRPRYITVGGRSFTHLRGATPFYVCLPGCKAIAFVTENTKNQGLLHVYDIDADRLIAFEGSVGSFGLNMGPSRGAGHPATDSIELRESTNSIVLKSFGLNWEQTASANLNTRKIEKIESTYFDDSGRIIKRHVQTMN